MARFTIEFSDSGVSDMLESMEFHDLDAAIAEAARTCRELIAEGARDGIDRHDWHCTIYDEEGRMMTNFSLSSVLSKGKPLE